MGFKKKAMASASSALSDLEAKAKSGAAERSRAADESYSSAMSEMRSKSAAKPAEKPAAKPVASSGSFGSAFAAARKSGDKTFTWRGKSYTTDVAGEKKPAARSTPTATRSTPRADRIPETKDTREIVVEGRRNRASMPSFVSSRGVKDYTRPVPMAPSGVGSKPLTTEQQRKLKEARARADANWKEAGKRVGYKKGGSIDGCAVRGKTKMKRK